MKNFEDMTDEEIEAIENAAIKSAQNMGAARDIYHEDYGWLLRDGEMTEAGIEFFKKHFPDEK